MATETGLNFIEEFFLEDVTVCDELIEFFNHSAYAKKYKDWGQVGSGINFKKKKSIDLGLRSDYDDPVAVKYMTELHWCMNRYLEKYPYAQYYSPFTIEEHYNIQYYKPGWGFPRFHTERGQGAEPRGRRHLVFMTYLNDVTDGGETEFIHQQLKIKPEKGKTVIWPADWTFTHRGLPSPTQEKYIATGWYSFND